MDSKTRMSKGNRPPDKLAGRPNVEVRPAAWLAGIAVVMLLLLAMLTPARAQVLDQDLWEPNYTVLATAIDGNTLYIAGEFSHVGPHTGFGAPLSMSSGAPIGGFPRVEGGAVRAAVPDGNGGWYIAGDFTSVGGLPRIGLARILADNSVSNWQANANNSVYALALSGSTVYIGGEFTNIGGSTRHYIAAVNATTAEVTSWNPTANSTVYALAVSDGTVFAGGWFTAIGDSARSYIAAIDRVSGLATAWDAMASGEGVYHFVYALALSGNTLYVGGAFTQMGGQPRSNVAALDASTAQATAWSPNADGGVTRMAVSGSTVYAGGLFENIGGQARRSLAALDATSGLATAWAPSLGWGEPNAGYVYVTALATSGGTVYVGGAFDYIGGQPRFHTAAIDASTGEATSWNPVTSERPEVIALAGSNVYVGGWFQSIGGAVRHNIAALDRTTGQLTAWNPDANYAVRALLVSGGIIYVGGEFVTIGGQVRYRIAALDKATGEATSWNPIANSHVMALAMSGNTIYAGGQFTMIGGQYRYRLAALDASTGQASTWDPGVDGEYVRSLRLSGNLVYAGGWFWWAGGETRGHLAAIDMTTGTATAWNPNANGRVEVLAISGNTVYAGGLFSAVGGQSRAHVAALDVTTGQATTWNPAANEDVTALAVSGSTVYVGGTFSSVGGQTRNLLAAVDSSTGQATAWNPNAGPDYMYVVSLEGAPGMLYAGGSFSTIAGGFRGGLAGLTTDMTPPASVADLSAQVGRTTAVLAWTASGDDGTEGTAAETRLAYSSGPITEANFWECPTIPTGQPKASGTTECAEASSLTACRSYYFALKTRDEANNWSAVSNMASGGTLCSGWLEVLCDESLMAGALEELPSSERVALSSRPTEFSLRLVSANPVHRPRAVRFRCGLPSTAHVRLDVYDLQGRRIATVADDSYAPGIVLIDWDGRDSNGRDLQPGMYEYQLQAGASFRATGKLLLLP